MVGRSQATCPRDDVTYTGVLELRGEVSTWVWVWSLSVCGRYLKPGKRMWPQGRDSVQTRESVLAEPVESLHAVASGLCLRLWASVWERALIITFLTVSRVTQLWNPIIHGEALAGWRGHYRDAKTWTPGQSKIFREREEKMESSVWLRICQLWELGEGMWLWFWVHRRHLKWIWRKDTFGYLGERGGDSTYGDRNAQSKLHILQRKVCLVHWCTVKTVGWSCGQISRSVDRRCFRGLS